MRIGRSDAEKRSRWLGRGQGSGRGHGAPDVLVFGPNAAKTQAQRLEDGVQKGSNQSAPESMDVEHKDIKDTQGRSAEPDGSDIDEGENESPAQGERDREQRGQDSVEPEASSVEQKVGQSPDELKALVRVRLSDDVLEGEVHVVIDLLLIPVMDVESHSEVLGADQGRSGRGSLLLLLGFLFLLLLLLFAFGILFFAFFSVFILFLRIVSLHLHLYLLLLLWSLTLSFLFFQQRKSRLVEVRF